MSRIAYMARITLLIGAAVGTVVVGVLVWGLRPGLPRFSEPTRDSVLLPVLGQVGIDLAWVAVICVLVRLAARVVLGLRRIEQPEHRQATARLSRVLDLPSRPGSHAQAIPHRTSVRSFALIVQAAPAPQPKTATVSNPERPTTSGIAHLAEEPISSICLLGPLTIEGAQQRGRRMRSLTTQLLLYLVLHADGATVETLADTLLPDTDFEKARGRLWQSATEAKRMFGDSFQRDSNGRYRLDRATIRIDVDELEQRLRDASRALDPVSETEQLERALALFRDAPMADTDLPWAQGDVRQLRATYVDLLERAALARLENGNARGATEAAERGIQVDQLNEGLWRLAMRADHELGLRDSINIRYEQLRSLLGQELGLQPSSETRHLCLDLLGQQTHQARAGQAAIPHEGRLPGIS